MIAAVFYHMVKMVLQPSCLDLILGKNIPEMNDNLFLERCQVFNLFCYVSCTPLCHISLQNSLLGEKYSAVPL